MIDKRLPGSAKPSCPLYQITVRGALKENWQDWFNGMLIATERKANSNTITALTCKVRDQAELIGIINWLHNMNLVIENVCLLPKGLETEEKI